MKLSINTKLLFYILSSSAIVFLAVLIFVSFNSRKISYNIATSIADSYAKQYADLSKGDLDFFMNSTRNLGKIFENYEAIPDTLRREVLSKMMRKVLAENDQFLSVWSILEPATIDHLDFKYKNKPGSTILGNFRYIYYKDNSEILLSQYVEQNPDEVLSGTVYNLLKSYKKEAIIDPYKYSYTGNLQDEILETNMVVPLIKDAKFFGVLGVDVPLGTLQKMIDKIKPFEKSYAFLLANNGEFVTHPDKSVIGKSFAKVYSDEEKKFSITKKIKAASTFSYTKNDSDGNQFYVTYAPINIGSTDTPWAIGIVVPVDIIMEKANKNFYISIIIGIIGLILLSFIVLILAQNISKPIIRVTKTLEKLAQGDIFNTQKIGRYTKDEIGKIEKSVDELIEGLTKTNEFALEIGKGNFDARYNLLSDDDQLGKSLIEMRENLQQAQIEESKKHEEDKEQNWITQGITKLGDILRQNHNDIEELSLNILIYLINYLNAQQGVFYLINDNDKNHITYDKIASEGYSQKIQLQKSYESGEGFIGQCAYEGDKIYFENVPEKYVKITSGLGESLPGSIIIFPLKLNDEILGIIQIDSLNKLKKYEIDFIDKVSDTIASTINGVRINIKTTQLLEQSQQQSEELAAQEEEMRQNMEEMEATQEEAGKREGKFNSLISSVKAAIAFAEFDVDGKYIDVNEKYCNILGLTRDQIMGKYHWTIGYVTDAAKTEIQEFWSELRNNPKKSLQRTIKTEDAEIEIVEKFNAIIDFDGLPKRYISLLLNMNEFVN